MSDTVNKPAHYNQGSIECIEAMKIVLTPEEFRGYLKGNVFKYLWREKDKNGIEDLRKAKWYLDRLVNLLDEHEQQKASDLQSLKDHPFGKLKQPKWTPKVGDWVKIKKPAYTQSSACIWVGSMNKYDGQIIEVKQFCEEGILHDNWEFMFDWLEPAEQSKATLNSDKIPEKYRKLNDSSEEPRQLGDLRWSVAEKRYIEISVDEIGYANRDNWAACRKVEPVVKQSLTPEPPDGWRWLEVGEVIRKGDVDRSMEPVTNWWIGEACGHNHDLLRRNRFDIGEKVVHINDNPSIVYTVDGTRGDGAVIVSCRNIQYAISPNKLAPYIEETT